MIETSWFTLVSLKWSHCRGVLDKITKQDYFCCTLAHQVTHNAVKPMEFGSKAARRIFVKCSWIIKLVLACLWERERAASFWPQLQKVCHSPTLPPSCFSSDPQRYSPPQELRKSQNTPLPHSHLPANMITVRVLTLAHNHSFDQSKTFSHTSLDLLFSLTEWFLPAIWTLRAN